MAGLLQRFRANPCAFRGPPRRIGRMADESEREVTGGRRAFGVLAALPEELGELAGLAEGRARVQGLELLRIERPGFTLHACVCGVGKVQAAHAAALLCAAEPLAGLWIVGTCGGLAPGLGVGTLVHCARAAQVDYALREGRELAADPGLLEDWKRAVPGPEAWFLTADRPVVSWWRRRRLARAYRGPAVADMETAAAAAVAARAGVPWAALRAVTDAADGWTGRSFRRNFPTQAPRAADSLLPLLSSRQSR